MVGRPEIEGTVLFLFCFELAWSYVLGGFLLIHMTYKTCIVAVAYGQVITCSLILSLHRLQCHNKCTLHHYGCD